MNKGENGVLIDCERMKYPYTGLYTYCWSLGTHLIRTPHAGHPLYFYVPPSLQGIFGEEVNYIKQQPLHKWLLPSPENIRVWHSTHQGSAYYPWRKNLKVLLTIHDLNYLYDNSRSEAKKKKYLHEIQAKIDRADHIVAISHYTFKDVQQHLNVAKKKCTVIYNGNTISEIVPLQQPLFLPSKPFLFTMGTIMAKKNFHVLPALLRGNDWLLLIAGITVSEAYKEQIVAEAKKYNVAGRVIFTGAINENDKQWYLKHCTAFLFPSLSEGFGFPVIEAMYFGTPVLLSTHTCLPEIGGDAAYYFNSFDADDMQQTLEESLHHYQQYNRAQAIHQRALLFDYRKSAVAYHALYEQLLDEK